MPKLFLFPKNKIASLRERRLIFGCEGGLEIPEEIAGKRGEVGVTFDPDSDLEIKSLEKEIERWKECVEYWREKLDDADRFEAAEKELEIAKEKLKILSNFQDS